MYEVSYMHNLGEVALITSDLASVLRNMCHYALCGTSINNVTIKRL